MKIFLFYVTIIDGEHEHRDYGLIRAKNREQALEIGTKTTHDFGDMEHTFWSYGDGQTASTPNGIKEISRQEADIIRRLRLVHFIN